jgi:lambda repressor-like predicted transcriptional regulator
MDRKTQKDSGEWRELPSYEDRLAHLPKFVREKIRDAQKVSWKPPCSKLSDPQRNAIFQTLEHGVTFSVPIGKTLMASVRSTFNKANNEIDLEMLSPLHVVILFSKYGFNPLEKYKAKRVDAQLTQSPWTADRENAAAERLRQLYGGMPSHGVLAAEPDFSALASYLWRKGKLEEFCKRHCLKRAIAQLPPRYENDEACRKHIEETYLKIINEFGRYVSNNCLSRYVTDVEHGISGNTLRAWIKKAFGSVEQLFIKLTEDGLVKKSWLYQINQCVSSDGRCMDSFQEVRFYEVFKRFLIDQTYEGPEIKIELQPFVPGSKLRADFLLGGTVFVEVLRHNLSELETPVRDDACKYQRSLGVRLNAFEDAGIKPFLIEPKILTDGPELLTMMGEIVQSIQSDFNPDESVYQISGVKASGTWYRSENRDAAISKILEEREPNLPFYAYPTHEEIKKHYGGLLAWLKLHKRKGELDLQAEALRIGLVASDIPNRRSASPLRVLTELETMGLINRYGFNLSDHEKIKELFGKDSVPFVLGYPLDSYSWVANELPGIELVLPDEWDMSKVGKGEYEHGQPKTFGQKALIDRQAICEAGDRCRCIPTVMKIYRVKKHVDDAQRQKSKRCKLFNQKLHWEILRERPKEIGICTSKSSMPRTPGYHLAFSMQRYGITGNDLARETGLARRKLTNLIWDRASPTLSERQAIAKALKIPIEKVWIEETKTLIVKPVEPATCFVKVALGVVVQ